MIDSSLVLYQRLSKVVYWLAKENNLYSETLVFTQRQKDYIVCSHHKLPFSSPYFLWENKMALDWTHLIQRWTAHLVGWGHASRHSITLESSVLASYQQFLLVCCLPFLKNVILSRDFASLRKNKNYVLLFLLRGLVRPCFQTQY